MKDKNLQAVPGSEALFASIFPERLTKGDRKKLEIVAAASDLAAQIGVEGFNYDDLAAHLNTTRSHITYHFPKRDDLNLSLIRNMMAQGHAYTFSRMEAATSAQGRLRAYLEGYIGFFAAHPGMSAIMVYFASAAVTSPAIRELQVQVANLAYARISELLRQWVLESGGRMPRDLEIRARQSQRLIFGGLMLALATSPRLDGVAAEQIITEVLQTIERILRGR